MRKRTIFMADEHCSHRAGLTPPAWQPQERRAKTLKYVKVQRECWRWYTSRMKDLQPIYGVINVGDAIDGKGRLSGGTELITTDRDEQCDMAEECIKVCQAKKHLIINGTGYHTGTDEDWEDILASRFGGKAHDHEWLKLGDKVFDIKHFVSSSITPHGRHTSLRREDVWNALWADANEAPRADFIIRAHVHYSVGNFEHRGGQIKWAMTLPALQAMGSKFGARRCAGTVNFGFMVVDVDDKGRVTWWMESPRIKAQVTRADPW